MLLNFSVRWTLKRPKLLGEGGGGFGHWWLHSKNECSVRARSVPSTLTGPVFVPPPTLHSGWPYLSPLPGGRQDIGYAFARPLHHPLPLAIHAVSTNTWSGPTQHNRYIVLKPWSFEMSAQHPAGLLVSSSMQDRLLNSLFEATVI